MPRNFAILPAAGRGTRLGGAKLLLPWRGRPLIEHALAAWRAASLDGLIVVVRPDDTDLARFLASLDVEVVTPETPPPDMKASISYGLAHLERRHSPQPADAWLMAPADLPTISTAVIEALLASWRGEGDSTGACSSSILVPTHWGKRGHPVLLGWSLAARVAEIPSDRGLDHLFERFPPQEIELGPLANPPDIDTPEDYSKLAESP